jgi:hypothetical protein
MTKTTTSLPESDERLGWRVAEFCKLIGMNRSTISKMAKLGQLNLIYFGDCPIVPRAEAIRLGLINA